MSKKIEEQFARVIELLEALNDSKLPPVIEKTVRIGDNPMTVEELGNALGLVRKEDSE